MGSRHAVGRRSTPRPDGSPKGRSKRLLPPCPNAIGIGAKLREPCTCKSSRTRHVVVPNGCQRSLRTGPLRGDSLAQKRKQPRAQAFAAARGLKCDGYFTILITELGIPAEHTHALAPVHSDVEGTRVRGQAAIEPRNMISPGDGLRTPRCCAYFGRVVQAPYEIAVRGAGGMQSCRAHRISRATDRTREMTCSTMPSFIAGNTGREMMRE